MTIILFKIFFERWRLTTNYRFFSCRDIAGNVSTFFSDNFTPIASLHWELMKLNPSDLKT